MHEFPGWTHILDDTNELVGLIEFPPQVHFTPNLLDIKPNIPFVFQTYWTHWLITRFISLQ